jgi:hypothetical protein
LFLFATPWAGRPSFVQRIRALDPEPRVEENLGGAVKTKTLFFVLLLLPVTSYAQTAEEWTGEYGLRAERRGNFAMGADFGLGLGNVDGYPNDAVKLDDPRYESDTGFALGPIGKFWLGGTIRDWFTFAIGVERLSLHGNGLDAKGSAYFLRTEFFPLYWRGGRYRDLGVYGDFGLGTLRNYEGDKVRASGGSLGHVGVGVFHETVRFGRFTLGPTIGYSTYFSETLKGHIGQLGLRMSFNSAP